MTWQPERHPELEGMNLRFRVFFLWGDTSRITSVQANGALVQVQPQITDFLF